MPSHVPRSNTTKKREQLTRRQIELAHAIHSGISREQVVGCAEALRAAHLSLLKAELHWLEEARIAGRDLHVDVRVRKIQQDMQYWVDRPVDDILSEHSTV